MSASATRNVGTAMYGAPAHDAMGDCMRALYESAARFIPANRVEQLVRQWLSPGQVEPERFALAILLAEELARSMTSLTGSGPFDRMARAVRQPTALYQQALAALRGASFRLLSVAGAKWDEHWSGLTDIATGQPVRIEGDDLPVLEDGVTVIARLAPLGNGRHRLAGTPMPLYPGALAIARGFIRPDKTGLSNPVRCAEAVFRDIVRHGPVPAPEAPPEPELPFRPDSNPLDALAAAWAKLDGDPPPTEREKARPLTNSHTILDCLASIAIAEAAGAARLSLAYTAILQVLLESLALRASHGSAMGGLDGIAQELDIAIRHGLLPATSRDLFDRVRERIKARPAAGARTDQELDKLLQRIRALRAKTVEQGCTEQEALAAAEKVAELLDRHGLTLSELDMRRQACEGAGIATDRKRRAPIDDCVPAIGNFFDCRHWGETAADGTLHYVFFGMPADVQAALYLYDLVVLAFASETAQFQAGTFYQTAHSSQRRSATSSFQLGLARGIVGKLSALREARQAAMRVGSGRDLVPIKASIVETELSRLGLTLRRKTVTRRSVLSDPYAAGQEAGRKFDYRPGIEQAG